MAGSLLAARGSRHRPRLSRSLPASKRGIRNLQFRDKTLGNRSESVPVHAGALYAFPSGDVSCPRLPVRGYRLIAPSQMVVPA